MDIKEAVLFKKFNVTRYAYQKLSYCKNCDRFTAVEGGACPSCGGNNNIPVEKLFDRIIKKRCHMEMLILTAMFLLGIIVSGSFMEIYLMLAAYLLLLAALLAIQSVFKKSESLNAAYYFFKKSSSHIKQNLTEDLGIICKGMESGEFKKVYENLRDVGMLLKNDNVRTSKLMCLDRFILRKDAELELDTLILSYYNPVLVNHIYEVSKIDSKLVKRNVIDYCVVNENMILKEKNGIEILSSVAGAAIRLKSNIVLYKDFIKRYVYTMRKDRLLRLHRMLREWPSDELKDLYISVNEIVQYNYANEI